MAGPKIPEDKIVKSKSKKCEDPDRSKDASEVKVRCPYCRTNTLTYRKMMLHVESCHSAGLTLGISCLSAGCMHYCTKSIGCISRHFKVNYCGETVKFELIPVSAGNISDDQHTLQCKYFNNKMSDQGFCHYWEKNRKQKHFKAIISVIKYANKKTNPKKISLSHKIANKLETLDKKFGRKDRKINE